MENQCDKKVLLPQDIGTDYSYKREIVWPNAIGFLLLHLCGLYGCYLSFHCHRYTIYWSILYTLISGLGVTLGAHRFYSHKCFNTTFTLRLILVILHTIAGQNCMFVWVRDHRLHHKYSDTDADPHNANRGFFFSHIGWLMSRKHPAVTQKGRVIDMSDLKADGLVMFQKKYYVPLYLICAFAFPIVTPSYYWRETYWNSLFVSYFFRYVLTLNVTWLINSANHLYGTKPYDKNMNPVENYLVSALALGEGWHNYHHSFPGDYRAAEFGVRYSITTLTIDILAYFGVIFDLKSAPTQRVHQKIVKKGDATHPHYDNIINHNFPDYKNLNIF